MRRLGALAALLILVQVSPAGSAPNATKWDIVRTYAGIRCTWKGGDQSQTVCSRSDRKGYAGAVARSFVSVFTVAPEHWCSTAITRFALTDTARSRTSACSIRSRITAFCGWSPLDGGAAICNRTDRHGYVLAVARELVSVTNERSQAVFVRNQPS